MATVESTLETVAQMLEGELEPMVDEMTQRMRDEVPGLAELHGPEFAAYCRRSCFANLRIAIDGVRAGSGTSPATPPEALQEARLAARLGIDLSPLSQTYRIGHAVAWERIVVALEDLRLSPAARRDALRLGSAYLFRYIDRVLLAVGEAYGAERAVLFRSAEQRRARLVHDVLAGADDDAGELGYDVHGAHLGLVAWGTAPELALQELGERLSRRVLIGVVGSDAVSGWLEAVELRPADWTAILDQRHGDVRIAVGRPGRGIDGFRRTHRQASRAQAVAMRTRAPVTRYGDVVVESLALTDEQAAAEFAADELGPLTHDDERSRRLRETLRAYLGTSCNATAAAAMLGVNDRTVAYRIRGIEDLLGHPVASRSVELQLALRLQDLAG
ncbi:PucR family transcriptional regulator [Patulibacter defluvii]|uniref:PucR family transcriptional regulator n=1 Tax=Patulibacter defluvii TaxID=3095358 RepID=UPI002A7637F9|nr:helix-turn-helix domain-containing protein [Patulibacter sp. DM4]